MESFDHAGNHSPYSQDENCFNLVGDEHLTYCGLEDDACETDSITDWNVSGKQTYRIERRCHSSTRDSPEIGTTKVKFEW